MDVCFLPKTLLPVSISKHCVSTMNLQDILQVFVKNLEWITQIHSYQKWSLVVTLESIPSQSQTATYLSLSEKISRQTKQQERANFSRLDDNICSIEVYCQPFDSLFGMAHQFVGGDIFIRIPFNCISHLRTHRWTWGLDRAKYS